MNSFHSPLKTHQAILSYLYAHVNHMWRYLRRGFTPGHCIEQVWVTASALWSQSVIAQKDTCWDTTSILQTPRCFLILFWRRACSIKSLLLNSEARSCQRMNKKIHIQNVFFFFLFLFVSKNEVGLIKKWKQQLAAKWHWSGKKSSFCTLLCFFHRRTDSCLSTT